MTGKVEELRDEYLDETAKDRRFAVGPVVLDYGISMKDPLAEKATVKDSLSVEAVETCGTCDGNGSIVEPCACKDDCPMGRVVPCPACAGGK